MKRVVQSVVAYVTALAVREKAKQLVELLNDTPRIREERDKARKLRDKYVGISNEVRRDALRDRGCVCAAFIIIIIHTQGAIPNFGSHGFQPERSAYGYDDRERDRDYSSGGGGSRTGTLFPPFSLDNHELMMVVCCSHLQRCETRPRQGGSLWRRL
jgi:hypothetical protein